MNEVQNGPGIEAQGAAPELPFTTQLRLAAGFLTVLPLMPQEAVAEDAVGASMAWFPLIGLAIGAALAVEDRLLALFLGRAIRSVLIVLSMAVLTGAVHLDAVADSADAMGAGRNRERALEILRDSRIGSFGAVSLFFVLALKVVALASAGGWKRGAVLILAPAIGRWAMVAVSWRMEYLRPSGAGSPFFRGGNGRNLGIASITVAAAILPFLSWAAGGAYTVGALSVALMRWFYVRWIGGVTGDLIGACGEIVETLAMVAIAA